jgi:phage tail-like protein
MDVNGTRFHLLSGYADWSGCLAENGDALKHVWQENEGLEAGDKEESGSLAWNGAVDRIQLKQILPIFQSSVRQNHLKIDRRRGADQDEFGHWYWIGDDEASVRFLARDARESVLFWRPGMSLCEPDSDFKACDRSPERRLLRGLAVTTRHYLVVGSVTEHGLLIFDLHAGGRPMLLQFSKEVSFTPFDISSLPDGGLLVLDRDNLRYWRLDAHFRPTGEATESEPLFQPECDPKTPIARQTCHPDGYKLKTTDDAPTPSSPIGIEPGPDGSVLILDDKEGKQSHVYRYDGDELKNAYPLVHPESENGKTDDLEGSEEPQPLYATHDFVYLEYEAGEDGLSIRDARRRAGNRIQLLVVSRGDGNQALAYIIDEDRLIAQPDYLPLRRWRGRALVRSMGRIYYDFDEQWAPLVVFSRCRYEKQGVLFTPSTFDAGIPGEHSDAKIPGQPFDSNIPGCVWHRVFLDAHIPAETAIQVRARAADDPDLLTQTGWTEQPAPYLRPGGSELPYHQPFEDPSARRGTWELLLQHIQGRYVQLEIKLLGNGQATPQLQSLRVWYPRFSYLDAYLPAIYRDDADSADFLERWLGNIEGFYTYIEENIEHADSLFDPRITPKDMLDWLAGWLGLVLDPAWSERRRRFFIRYAHEFFRYRGTLPGIEIAVRLYTDENPTPDLFNPDCWGRSDVRVIERFLTREVSNYIYGDPTDNDNSNGTAHRFTVLAPHRLDDEQAAMVERIIELERPAHTAFELKRYWDVFRVGTARVGRDTQIGCSRDFVPLLLGEAPLPAVHLASPYPKDRIIADRDSLGDYPEL